MEVCFTEKRYDWRSGNYNPYKKYKVEGETEEECFKKIYSYVRSARYCSDVLYELDDKEQHLHFETWKHTKVDILMYYGGGTVD